MSRPSVGCIEHLVDSLFCRWWRMRLQIQGRAGWPKLGGIFEFACAYIEGHLQNSHVQAHFAVLQVSLLTSFAPCLIHGAKA